MARAAVGSAAVRWAGERFEDGDGLLPGEALVLDGQLVIESHGNYYRVELPR